ncbi:MAG: hydroxymethylbilane synthase [Alphaproteobacteria bacterium]|nr:hydroxymethylbilane synthase [Alphaproteobacteria bacterium]
MQPLWPNSDSPLRIGTRGSPLALAQAYETRRRLIEMHGFDEISFEIVVIKTTGDKIQDKPLRELGGKGLFTKEIEEALLGGRIDIAVHSMKDMPVLQPEGLALDCFLPREDPRDAFLSPVVEKLSDLPAGSKVGTSSLRRRAQVLYKRPDLKVVEFRGNVQTRLRKLDEGVASCTFLAMAGLNRLGMEGAANAPVSLSDMLPAVAQGAIGIERRGADETVKDLLSPIHDFPTGYRLDAERAYLRTLEGSCEMPIAGLAEIRDRQMRLRGEILRPDGSECLSHEVSGPVDDAVEMGVSLAQVLLGEAGPYFFD